MKGRLDYLFILILYFFLSFALQAEQLERLSWGLRDDWVFLYRIHEGHARGEIELAKKHSVRRNSQKLELSGFILNTPVFQFGSFSPAGLWAFGDMTSPLDRRVLEKKNPLRISRGAFGMEDFAASLCWPRRLGIFYMERKKYRQAALWGRIHFLSYGQFNFGTNLHFPKAEEPKTPEKSAKPWFSKKEERPSKAFGQVLLGGRYDFSNIGLYFQGGCSCSPYLLPGFSLLPSFLWTVEDWEFYSRFWYVSPFWRNSKGMKPPWRWQWQGRLSYYYAMGRILGAYSEGRSASNQIRREGKISAQLELENILLSAASRLAWNLRSREESLDFENKGKIRWSLRKLRFQLEGTSLLKDWESHTWGLDLWGQYRFFGKHLIQGECKVKVMDGLAKMTPGMKLAFPIGDFLLKGVWKYDIYYPVNPEKAEYPIHLGLSIQWRQSSEALSPK